MLSGANGGISGHNCARLLAQNADRAALFEMVRDPIKHREEQRRYRERDLGGAKTISAGRGRRGFGHGDAPRRLFTLVAWRGPKCAPAVA